MGFDLLVELLNNLGFVLGRIEVQSPKVRRKSKQMNGDNTQHWADAFQSPVPSVHGKRCCRMHGGALGSGAPRGNKNALNHGRYTRGVIAERGHIRELVRQARRLLLQIE